MFKAIATVYYIKQQSFETMEQAYKDYLYQKEVLKQIQKEHPEVTIVITCGDVNGHLVEKYNARAGQVGHPKYEFKSILGPNSKVSYKVRPHIHIYFIGLYAATTSRKFSLMMCERFYKNHPNTTVRKMPFFSSPTDDHMFSEKYLTDQARYISYIGDRDQLTKFDRDINPPEPNGGKPNERWKNSYFKKSQNSKQKRKRTEF